MANKLTSEEAQEALEALAYLKSIMKGNFSVGTMVTLNGYIQTIHKALEKGGV